MDTASSLKEMKDPAVVVAQKSFHLKVYEARLTGIADMIMCEMQTTGNTEKMLCSFKRQVQKHNIYIV